METLQTQLANINAQIVQAKVREKAMKKLQNLKVNNKNMFKREFLERIIKG